MPIRSDSDGDAAVLTHRCDRCGGPIEVLDLVGLRISWSGRRSTVEWNDDATYLCHRCRVAAAAPGERDELAAHYARLLAIRDRLGIPPGVTLHLFTGHGRRDVPRFRDFHLALFGIQVRKWDDDSPIPYLRVVPNDGRRPIEFAFPQIAIGREGIPAALECRWSTQDPSSSATALEIAGWQGDVKLTDLHDLLDGLALLRDFPPKGGRKKDVSKTIPPNVFAAEISRVYGKQLEAFGTHPSRDDLADAFCVSVSTIGRCIKRYRADGNRWPPVSGF